MTFLFSRQLDKKAKVWDLYGKCMLFELTTGPEPGISQSNGNQMGIHVAKTMLRCSSLPISRETYSKECERTNQELIAKLIGFHHWPSQERRKRFIMAVKPAM